MMSTSKDIEIQLSVRERELLKEALSIVDCRGKNQTEIHCSGLIQCRECPFGIVTGKLQDYLGMKDGKFLVQVSFHDAADD